MADKNLPEYPDYPPPPYPGDPTGQYTHLNASDANDAAPSTPSGSPSHYPMPPAATPVGQYMPESSVHGYNPKSATAYGYAQHQPTGFVAAPFGPTQPHMYVTSPTVVITTQPERHVTRVSHHEKPRGYMALAVITCLCFSPLFGLPAICFAVMSDYEYTSGKLASARRSALMSLSLSIIGIALTTIIVAIVVGSGSMHHRLGS
ncbi:hypothetical protein LSAT2_008513 [Lamellibrachia satsuma]|nr:hypothetical protein LSAT2_008513 [Lamellibrachia satsuma]